MHSTRRVFHEKGLVNQLLMILRPRLWPQSLLQAVTRPSCLSSASHHPSNPVRPLHSLPTFSSEKQKVFSRYGVPGFLSKATYDETWTAYQTALIDHINTETAGTTLENIPPKRLHEVTSRQPSKAVLYNHAAQAHHNDFFFRGLSALPDPIQPAETFRGTIEEWFDSLDHLREEIIDNAMGMFGNGYLWLMCENTSNKTMRLLCTYNAGSPFPDAHTRKQAMDMSTGAGDLGTKLTQAGAFGAYSGREDKYYQGALKATPILCVKLWEHQWMRDYGLLGKEAYLQAWWKAIDWDAVLFRYNQVPDDAGSSYMSTLRR